MIVLFINQKHPLLHRLLQAVDLLTNWGMPLVPHVEYEGSLEARGESFFYFYGKRFSDGEVKDRVAGRSIIQCNKWMQSVSK